MIPVIFSPHTDKWIQCVIQNEHQTVFPGRRQQPGRRERAEILTTYCRPLSDVSLTRKCLKLFCQNTLSEHRILFFSGFSDSLLSVCPVFCYIATWNQVKVTRCGRRCFACHHGEPKACFAVASSLFGEQAQDRVIAICSLLSCGNGWVACLAPLNFCSAERTESKPARSWLYWSAEEQQRAQEFIRDLRKTELL